MLPEINKVYNHFDDGKIKHSRRYSVKITEVIPFTEAAKGLIKCWEEAVEISHWLYAKETGFFIVGLEEESEDEVIYARTLNGGWFSFNSRYGGGRLDIDGSLTKILNENG